MGWGLPSQSSICAEKAVRVLVAGTLSVPASKQDAPWSASRDMIFFISLLSAGEAAAGVLCPAHQRYR